MNKIEQYELDQLKELKKSGHDLLAEFGDISMVEIVIRERRENAEKVFKELREKEHTMKEFLLNRYGKELNINLETGEY